MKKVIWIGICLIGLLSRAEAQQKTQRPRRVAEVVWYVETNVSTETSWVTFDRPIKESRVRTEVEHFYYLQAPKHAPGWPEPVRIEVWQNGFTVHVYWPCKGKKRIDLMHLPELAERVAKMLFYNKKISSDGIRFVTVDKPKVITAIIPQHPYRKNVEFTCKRASDNPPSTTLKP